MIYFVDEDYRKLRVLMSELKINNFEVELILDADSALAILSKLKPNDVDLVIIDVMLAVNPDYRKSKYTREETDDFQKTGLLLLDDLTKVNPNVFPEKAVFHSHASSEGLLKDINSYVEKYKVNLLRKGDYNTAYEFGKEIINLIKGLQ